MLLRAVSKSDQDHSPVVAEILKTEPFLNHLEFTKTKAEAVAYKNTNDPTGSMQARAKGAEYVSATDLNKSPASATVCMHGLPVTIDKLEIQAHYDIPALKASKMIAVARNFARELVALLHNGTGTNNKIKGLINLVDASYTFGETNGTDLNSAAGQKTFLRQLDQQIADLDPDVISLHPYMWAWMQEVARQMHALTWSKNEFGKPVANYCGLPMYPIRNSGITLTETKGTASGICTSVYLTKFAELDDLCFHTTEGIDVTPIQITDSMVIKKGQIELYGTPVLYKTKAIARLNGLYFA